MKVKSSEINNIPGFIQKIHAIAQQFGYKKNVKSLIEYSEEINRTTKYVSIYGGIDIDLLNEIIGQPIFANSILPIILNIEIATCTENETPYCLINGLKNTLNADYINNEQQMPLKIFVNNEWMRKNSIVINIRPYPEVTDNEVLTNLNLFSKTDISIFFIDALAPIKKVEDYLIKKCITKEMPIIVSISRLQMMNDEDKNSVIEFISQYINKYFPIASFLNAEQHDKVSIKVFQNCIETKFKTFDVKEKRIDYFFKKALIELVAIREQIINKKNENNEKISELKQLQKKEKILLDIQKDHWVSIENMLISKRQNLEKQLQEHLSKNREQLLGLLLFELSRSNDTKGSWERDIPFFINRELQKIGEQLSNGFNKQILETLQWIEDEIYKNFEFKVNKFNALAIKNKEASVELKKLSLINSQKLRINSKYGAAATVVGVGALFVSIPVGGLVVASSIIYQALVEQHVFSKTKKEKVQIENELHKVVEVIELEYINEFSNKLKECYEIIVKELKTRQYSWFKEKANTIENNTINESKKFDNTIIDESLTQINSIIAELV